MAAEKSGNLGSLFEELLDGIEARGVVEVAEKKIREQRTIYEAWTTRWKEILDVVTKRTRYLAEVDPILTEGLLIMAQKTWGKGNFSFSKDGQEVNLDGLPRELDLRNEIRDVIINLEEIDSKTGLRLPKFMPVWRCQDSWEARWGARTRTDDPSESFYSYSVGIEFDNGEPSRVRCGNQPFDLPLGFPLAGYSKHPSKEELMDILAGHYKRGPIFMCPGAYGGE